MPRKTRLLQSMMSSPPFISVALFTRGIGSDFFFRSRLPRATSLACINHVLRPRHGATPTRTRAGEEKEEEKEKKKKKIEEMSAKFRSLAIRAGGVQMARSGNRDRDSPRRACPPLRPSPRLFLPSGNASRGNRRRAREAPGEASIIYISCNFYRGFCGPFHIASLRIRLEDSMRQAPVAQELN